MNSAPRLLWQQEAKLNAISDIAAKIYRSLKDQKYFCLWLEGEIGAGKTTLTAAIFRAFGLPASIPVTSPTYAYINDYVINEKKFAHIDLYRAHADFSPGELFHLEEEDYVGLVVEWPEVVSADNSLQATHRLTITYLAANVSRLYSFYSLTT